MIRYKSAGIAVILILLGFASKPPPPPPEIPCAIAKEGGEVTQCTAPCGCVFSGIDKDVVSCEHGSYTLDP